MRCCLVSVTVIALLLVVAALFFGAMAVMGPEMRDLISGSRRAGGVGTPSAAVTGTALPRATPTPVRPTATAAPGETQLTQLTDADLTQALQTALAGRKDGPTLENARVQATGGRVIARGVLRGLLPVGVEITGRVEVRNGRPLLVVERVEGAGLPLPESARQELEGLVNAMNLMPTRTDVEVTRVEVGEGVVTVFGRRR